MFHSSGASSRGHRQYSRAGASGDRRRSWGGSARQNSSGKYAGRNPPSADRHSYGGHAGRFNGSRRSFRTYRGQGNRTHIPREKYVNMSPDLSGDASVYVSSKTFDEYGIPASLKRNIAQRDYIHPTKIQDQVIPHVLAGKDILGLASTGSGKTAAFLIPIMSRILTGESRRCLIITPTRELAVQIRDEVIWLSQDIAVKSVLTIGGANLNRQIHSLRENHEIVIGTPGRLRDLHTRRSIQMEAFGTVVLDEVDRMLDMGFIHDIRELISTLSSQKQSLFFSATISHETERLANELLMQPVRIQTESQKPAVSVEQNIVTISPSQNKVDVLNDLLQHPEFEKVLVFSRTKYGADRLARDLSRRGHTVDSIHGNKSQRNRIRAIEGFRKNAIKVLIATDVASRGIDVQDITHVINYDEPATYEDYIHRIGRTGRVGKKGTALTFVQ